MPYVVSSAARPCSKGKDLYAECRVIGGTAVFHGLVEPVTFASAENYMPNVVLSAERPFYHVLLEVRR